MKKYDASPGLEGGYESAACRSQASFRGAVKSTVACSTGSIGLRSAPPPNHALVVTMWRVFMCTAGTRGERRSATREIPLAQNRGFSSATGIFRANYCEKPPNTVGQFPPPFSNTPPARLAMTQPRAGETRVGKESVVT